MRVKTDSNNETREFRDGLEIFRCHFGHAHNDRDEHGYGATQAIQCDCPHRSLKRMYETEAGILFCEDCGSVREFDTEPIITKDMMR